MRACYKIAIRSVTLVSSSIERTDIFPFFERTWGICTLNFNLCFVN